MSPSAEEPRGRAGVAPAVQALPDRLAAPARVFVCEPDVIGVRTVTADGGVVFIIDCAVSDIGRLVGRGGVVIHLLRARVGAEAATFGLRSFVDIGGSRRVRTR